MDIKIFIWNRQISINCISLENFFSPSSLPHQFVFGYFKNPLKRYFVFHKYFILCFLGMKSIRIQRYFIHVHSVNLIHHLYNDSDIVNECLFINSFIWLRLPNFISKQVLSCTFKFEHLAYMCFNFNSFNSLSLSLIFSFKFRATEW